MIYKRLHIKIHLSIFEETVLLSFQAFLGSHAACPSRKKLGSLASSIPACLACPAASPAHPPCQTASPARTAARLPDSQKPKSKAAWPLLNLHVQPVLAARLPDRKKKAAWLSLPDMQAGQSC